MFGCLFMLLRIIFIHLIIRSTLSGCVVAENVTVAEKCELKDCLLGSGQAINAMGKWRFILIIIRMIKTVLSY